MFEQDRQFIRDLIGNLDTCYFTMCRSVPESTTFPKPFSLWHGDPFKLNWGGYYLKTFPPFSLLSRRPLKLLGQDKLQGLLIAYFPIFLRNLSGQLFFGILLCN